jgi:hypothetical protein
MYEIWTTGRIIPAEEDRNIRSKTRPSDTSSTTNPICLARDYTQASSVTRWPLHVCGVVNLNSMVHQPITKISATATKG